MYDFNCWVCFELYTEPVTLFCQHSFCKACLEKSFKIEPICPFCKVEIQLPLPPIDKALNKRILKLKGIEVPDSDNEDDKNKNKTNNTNNNIVENKIQSPQIKRITCDISSLPSIIYPIIFQYFSSQKLVEWMTVSKQFNKILNHSWIWKSKLLQEFQFSTSIEKYDNFKDCYKTHYKYEKNSNKGASGTFKMIPFRGHTQPITAIDHFGNIMCTGSIDNTVKVWDLKAKKNNNLLTFENHTDRITCLKQRQYTITSGSADSTCRINDLETGKELNCFTHKSGGDVKSIHYNSLIEGQLITQGEEQILIWDHRRNGKESDRMLGLYGQIISSQFNSDGYFFTNTLDYLDKWDMRKQDKPLVRINGVEWFQPTIDYIYAKTHNNTLVQYDIKTGKLLHSHSLPGILSAGPILPHPPIAPLNPQITYQPNYPVPPNLNIVPPGTTVPPPVANNNNASVGPTIITATNNSVAYAVNNNVQVLDNQLKPLSTLSNHTNKVNSILIDDKKILTGSMDNTIKVWDGKKYNRLYSLLGGSNTVVNPNDPVPLVQGCSNIRYDNTRIIGVFNNLVRLYNFNLD